MIYSPIWQVRKAVAEHGNKEHATRLQSDKSKKVAKAAAKRLESFK